MGSATTLRIRDRTILTAGPSITQKEIDCVLDAVTNGWNTNWAGYITAFEKAFAEYIGVRYAMTTSSRTGARHLGLLALGVGLGDEVIMPDIISWVEASDLPPDQAERHFVTMYPPRMYLFVPPGEVTRLGA